MPRYELDGKVALITGGAQGIGLGLAQALRARGARLALLDLDADRLQAAASRFGAAPPLTVAADVTDARAMGDAIAQVTEHLGGLDVVVANAGIAPAPATVRAMGTAEFERVIEVDLLGVYRTVAPAIDPVVARQGQIVVVSSVYAFLNGMLVAPYAAAKAGVEQLGRALRVELAPHGAGVTVAYFGFVDTQMVQQAVEAGQGPGELEQDLLPAFVRRRITPEQAGEALARGIERRRARVIAPRWWAALSTMRGILNPVGDLAMSRFDRLAEILRDADREARERARCTAAR